MSTNEKSAVVASVPSTANNVTVREPATPLHAFALRGAIVGCGLLGAYLFIRNSKLFATIKHVNQIPESYFRKETKLRGIIRALDSNGTIKLEHQPEIGLPRFLRPKKHPSELLRIRLAGLDVSKAGVEYLIKDLKLKDKQIIFNVIKPTAGDTDTADADVTLKKTLLGAVNLNTDLVRKGYARVYTLEHPSHYEALQNNSAYSRLVTRLLTSEKVAERRGIGIWERGDSWVESIQSFPYVASQMFWSSSITKFAVLLGRVFYDFCLVVYSVLRHGYYIGIATAEYIASAYRVFGDRVDRLTKFYDQQKLRFQQRTSSVKSPSAIKKD
jgi:endonuclease YncB( thermonuclease family)